MNRCLRDRTLWMLSEGEGSAAQWAHLEACAACSGRYQRLGRDLRVLRRVLDESPPSSAIPRRPRVLDGRWLPVAAALALTLVWFGGHLALRSPSPHRSHPETQHDAFSYVEAALDGSWPCDGQEPFFHLECDPHASAILAEGP